MKFLKIAIILALFIFTTSFVVKNTRENNKQEAQEQPAYKASMDGWEVDVNKAYEISTTT